MNKDIQAMSDYGIINGSGNVTDIGETAFGIASSEKYGAMTAKNKAFENFDAKHFKQQAIAAYLADHKMDPKVADNVSKATNAVEKEMNRLGLTEDATPEQIAGAVAAMGATNYSSSKSLNFLGMNMNMGLGGDGSSRIDTQGGEKTSIDNTTTLAEGIRESIGHLKQLHTTGKFDSQIAAYEKMKRKKFDPNSQESWQDLTEYVHNSDMANSMKQDFFGHMAAVLGEDGAAMAGMIAGGFAVNGMFGNPAGKTWRGFKKAGGKIKESFSSRSHNEPVNETTNSSGYHQNPETHKGVNNEPSHINSPSNEMPNSTTKAGGGAVLVLVHNIWH
jgi:hypothetical protein